MLRRRRILPIVLFSVTWISEAPGTEILFVHAAALDGGDGLSWETAFNDLQEALQTAAGEPSFREVWVAAGVYRPDQSTGDRNSSFVLQNNLSILGGFDGTEGDRSERRPDDNITILDGDLEGNDIPGADLRDPSHDDNVYHVVSSEHHDSTAVLDGFTVRRGRAIGDENLQRFGAGALLVSSSPTLVRCVFEDCHSLRSGAGLAAIPAADLMLDSCTFRACRALGSAAGALLSDASQTTTIRLYRCLFEDNLAGSEGGGMNVQCMSLTVEECSFRRNVVGQDGNDDGGAAWASCLDETWLDCAFEDNQGTDGGALWTGARDTLTVSRCSFARNLGKIGGALYRARVPETLVEDCDFRGNQAGGGGAIWTEFGELFVRDCRFINNEAGIGGAVLARATLRGSRVLQRCADSERVPVC